MAEAGDSVLSATSGFDSPDESYDDIMHYFVHEGVRLPPFCRGKMEDILNFPVRKDDLWIVTYPKSGLWAQDLVYLISKGGKLEEVDLDLETVEDSVPYLEYPSPGLEALHAMKSPRLIKSHLPYKLLPLGVRQNHCKVIYVSRNPKDVMCSFYDFHRMVRMVNYKGTFNQFFHRFLNNKLAYGSYFDHTLDWWNHKDDKHIMFIKYEDLKKNLAVTVDKISCFMGVSLSSDLVEQIVEYWGSVTQYNRREDRVGYWKNMFTVAMNEKFERVQPVKMKDVGLHFDFGECY
ncbi:sulfotransferase 4A1-like [Saccoglossus kowalevskii]|uniref:Sulfotransferase 4A1-like n=1 Tax=Saccoglossus kowalevskii TaxID=10224 RepID=A0ABM0M897_SACKO|nr:PREDICTED: sulfotransferase 4A1-like [Saccoglossus kowalevskii]